VRRLSVIIKLNCVEMYLIHKKKQQQQQQQKKPFIPQKIGLWM